MSRSTVLVDAPWVLEHLDDAGVVLVEVDEETSAYDKDHIRRAGGRLVTPPPALCRGAAG